MFVKVYTCLGVSCLHRVNAVGILVSDLKIFYVLPTLKYVTNYKAFGFVVSANKIKFPFQTFGLDMQCTGI